MVEIEQELETADRYQGGINFETKILGKNRNSTLGRIDSHEYRPILLSLFVQKLAGLDLRTFIRKGQPLLMILLTVQFEHELL